MKALLAKLKAFWADHVQKSIGSVLGGLAATDLLTSLAGYESDITSLIGTKAYAAIRVTGAILIVIRASQHRKPPQEDSPK